MKKSYSFAIAAIFAALMSIPSCSYLEEPGKNENTGKELGTRTVNLCFPQTKTTLDGYQPVWSADDKIVLADGTGVEYYEVKAKDAGKAQLTITTNLTGIITAVYPSDAAVVEGKEITGVNVSESQNGSFANANICLAVEDDESSNLMFKNQTAVIKVRVPAGTTKLTVKSLGKIGENGQRGKTAADTVRINSAENSVCNITTVQGEYAFDGDSCFVSVLVVDDNPLYLTDLNFDVEYTDGSKETHKAQGGFSPLSIKAAGVADPYTYKVKKNDLHTLAVSSLHEYITVGEGDNARKWATMNVGASSSTDAGLYFAWGETTGLKPSGNTFTFPDTKYYSADNSTWNKSKGFAWVNCPYTNGEYENSKKINVFTKYVPSAKSGYWGGIGNADDKITLDLEDDAAFWNWGGSWRMPTQGEFFTFISGYSYTGGDFTHQGVTFPFAGYGSGANLSKVFGTCWTSSLTTSAPDSPYCLRFNSNNGVGTFSFNRFVGQPVRPFSE